MLVLSRRTEESVRIGEDVVVKILRIGPGVVRIGIDAPEGVKILRNEIIEGDGEDGENVESD